MDVIYLIECQDFYKVGKTANLENRLATFRTANPFELVLLDYFPSVNIAKDEQFIHEYLKKYHYKREWFKLPSTLIACRNQWFFTRYGNDKEQSKESAIWQNHTKLLTVTQVQQIIDCARSTRDKLIIKVGFIAGLKVSQIIALTWGDLQNGKLIIKTNKKNTRFVDLPSPFMSELLEFKGAASDDAPMFQSRKGGKHLSQEQISRIVKDAAIASGNSEKISLHWLRLSHANHALKKGVSLIEIHKTLGNSSLQATAEYFKECDKRTSSNIAEMLQY